MPDQPVALPADEAKLLELWRDTPVAHRRAFVAAVDAAGKAHLSALIAGARRLARTNREQARPLMMLLSPYLVEPTSTEIAVESMLGHLRANNRDAKQGELAERVLHRQDMLRPRDDDDDD
jgi:hypothetical protein